jgi:DNA-binding transcriptional LysR family regulator
MTAAVDLNRIATFVRVVDEQSFTAAAKTLGLPKSSVSRSVAALEAEVGVRLLVRTTRKLALTDAGRAFYERARDAVAGLEEATAAVADMGREPRGTVRLTAPADLGQQLLPDVVARFTRKHPHIRLEVVLTGRVVDMVEEGFDLAVRAARLDDSSLVARRLGSGALGLFASSAYLRRRGRPKNVAELATHECVLFRGSAGRSTWRLTGPNGVETVEVNGVIDVDDMGFVHGAVAAGAGVGLLPLFLTPETDGERIVRVLPDYALRGATVHLVSPPGRLEPARVKLFRDFLVAAWRDVRWG